MTTEFLDKVFIKEFRDMVKSVRTQNSFNIDLIVTPPLEQQIDTGIKVYINNIEDKIYGKLNKNYVTDIQQRTVTRNIYWKSGEVKGTEDFHAGSNRIIVRTELQIGIPFGYQPDDKDLEYVDYRDTQLPDGNIRRFYFYAIPTKYLYRVSNTALVLADKKKPNHYGGVRLLSTWGYYIYLYIVNVKGLKDIDTQRIIKTGINPNTLYQSRDLIIEYLTETEQIFNPLELEVTIPIDGTGSTNLSRTDYESNIDYEERHDLTIAEEEMSAKQISGV